MTTPSAHRGISNHEQPVVSSQAVHDRIGAGVSGWQECAGTGPQTMLLWAAGQLSGLKTGDPSAGTAMLLAVSGR